jgi:hypothetical protein
MAEFTFKRDWSGYSRGYDIETVEADSLEEALDKVGNLYEREVVRDDTDSDEWVLEE